MRENGFTLLEVVLVAGLAIIVGTLLITILVQNNGFYYKQNSIIAEGLSLNDAMRGMDTYIRQAVAVASTYIDGTTSYTSDGQTLVLKLPSLNSEEIIENTYDFVVITKDSEKPNVLRLRVFPDVLSSRKGENLVLTTLVESYNFKYLDKAGNEVPPPSAVAVENTLSVLSKTGSIQSNRTSSSIVTLRNTSL